MSIPSNLLPAAAPVSRNPVLQQTPDLIGTTALTLAPASPFTKIDGKQAPLDADVYMTYFGNSIDVIANSNFVTFQIRVNGSPFKKPFDQITSQIGAANLPTHFPSPFLLGRGVLVEIFGSVAVGAAGNTVLSTQMGLLYTAPGKVPVA
jgi:hypothetical protein